MATRKHSTRASSLAWMLQISSVTLAFQLWKEFHLTNVILPPSRSISPLLAHCVQFDFIWLPFRCHFQQAFEHFCRPNSFFYWRQQENNMNYHKTETIMVTVEELCLDECVWWISAYTCTEVFAVIWRFVFDFVLTAAQWLQRSGS